MKGKVEEIFSEQTRSGVDYLRVQIDGETYSVWDQQYFDAFQEGDMVEFDYRESGQWKNITNLAVIDSTSKEGKERAEYFKLRDKYITRMSCLKSAAYLLANDDSDSSTKGRDALSLGAHVKSCVNCFFKQRTFRSDCS